MNYKPKNTSYDLSKVKISVYNGNLPHNISSDFEEKLLLEELGEDSQDSSQLENQNNWKKKLLFSRMKILLIYMIAVLVGLLFYFINSGNTTKIFVPKPLVIESNKATKKYLEEHINELATNTVESKKNQIQTYQLSFAIDELINESSELIKTNDGSLWLNKAPILISELTQAKKIASESQLEKINFTIEQVIISGVLYTKDIKNNENERKAIARELLDYEHLLNIISTQQFNEIQKLSEK